MKILYFYLLLTVSWFGCSKNLQKDMRDCSCCCTWLSNGLKNYTKIDSKNNLPREDSPEIDSKIDLDSNSKDDDYDYDNDNDLDPKEWSIEKKELESLYNSIKPRGDGVIKFMQEDIEKYFELDGNKYKLNGDSRFFIKLHNKFLKDPSGLMKKFTKFAFESLCKVTEGLFDHPVEDKKGFMDLFKDKGVKLFVLDVECILKNLKNREKYGLLMEFFKDKGNPLDHNLNEDKDMYYNNNRYKREFKFDPTFNKKASEEINKLVYDILSANQKDSKLRKIVLCGDSRQGKTLHAKAAHEITESPEENWQDMPTADWLDNNNNHQDFNKSLVVLEDLQYLKLKEDPEEEKEGLLYFNKALKEYVLSYEGNLIITTNYSKEEIKAKLQYSYNTYNIEYITFASKKEQSIPHIYGTVKLNEYVGNESNTKFGTYIIADKVIYMLYRKECKDDVAKKFWDYRRKYFALDYKESDDKSCHKIKGCDEWSECGIYKKFKKEPNNLIKILFVKNKHASSFMKDNQNLMKALYNIGVDIVFEDARDELEGLLNNKDTPGYVKNRIKGRSIYVRAGIENKEEYEKIELSEETFTLSQFISEQEKEKKCDGMFTVGNEFKRLYLHISAKKIFNN